MFCGMIMIGIINISEWDHMSLLAMALLAARLTFAMYFPARVS